MRSSKNQVSQTELLYEQLEKEILTLEIKPGQILTENELCERFGISRTPIRTILQRLENADLVEIIPYKGTVVKLLDLDFIKQVIYMRVAVEAMVLKEIIKDIDPMTVEKLRYNLKRQEVLLGNKFEPHEFYTLDSKFHETIMVFNNKLKLWNMIQKHQVSYTRFRMLDIVAMKNFMQIYKEHVELFQMIESKQTEGLDALVEKHLYGGINRLGDKIKTDLNDYFVK